MFWIHPFSFQFQYSRRYHLRRQVTCRSYLLQVPRLWRHFDVLFLRSWYKALAYEICAIGTFNSDSSRFVETIVRTKNWEFWTFYYIVFFYPLEMASKLRRVPLFPFNEAGVFLRSNSGAEVSHTFFNYISNSSTNLHNFVPEFKWLFTFLRVSWFFMRKQDQIYMISFLIFWFTEW